MLSEKSVRCLTPTTTTPPLAGFSSLEMAIDGMERRANASTVSASTPRSLGFPAFRLKGQLSPKVVPRYAPTLLRLP
jgi:hypothetical protein